MKKTAGFITAEILVALTVVSLFFVIAIPTVQGWYEKQLLWQSAQKIAMDLRAMQQLAKSRDRNNMHTQELYIVPTENIYRIIGTGARIEKEYQLPKELAFPGGPGQVGFYYTGQPITGSTHIERIQLKTIDGKYRIAIVIQALTGRIRLEWA